MLFSCNRLEPNAACSRARVTTSKCWPAIEKGGRTTSNICSVVLGGMSNKCTPSTTNIQQPITLLQIQFITNHSHLVILQFLKSFHLVDIFNKTTGVNHPLSEEPGVEIVSSVVVVSDLFFILGSRVHDHLGDEVEEDVSEELPVSSITRHPSRISLPPW
jgi:hypothetical protein